MSTGHVTTPCCEGHWGTRLLDELMFQEISSHSVGKKKKEWAFGDELVIYRAVHTSQCDPFFLSIFHINGAHVALLYLEDYMPRRNPTNDIWNAELSIQTGSFESSEVHPSQCRSSSSSERWGEGIVRVELIKQMFIWQITAQLNWACRKWKPRKVAIPH